MQPLMVTSTEERTCLQVHNQHSVLLEVRENKEAAIATNSNCLPQDQLKKRGKEREEVERFVWS